MSGRAPQRAPKDSLKIRTESPEEDHQIYQWMTAGNGFPFHVPVLDEGDLRISRDGRTLYGEKFLVRIGRESDSSRIPRWDYQMNRAGDDLVRKRFAYPVVRSLWDYAPDVAARIGLRPRYVSIHLSLGSEPRVEECPKCGELEAVAIYAGEPESEHQIGTYCSSCNRMGVER